MRRSNIDACAGTIGELAPILEQIRAAWPTTKILIRADSGFCREEIMAWCEANDVDFVLGLARNERLVAMVEYHLGMAQCAFSVSMKSERVYGDLEYRTLDT